MLRRERQLLAGLFALSDAAAAAATFLGAYWVRFHSGLLTAVPSLGASEYVRFLALVVPAALVSCWVLGLYRLSPPRRPRDEAAGLVQASGLLILVLTSALYALRQVDISRGALLIFMAANPAAAWGLRRALAWWMARRAARTGARQYVLVVGAGELAAAFLERLQANPLLPYAVVGCLDDGAAAPPGPGRPPAPVLGALADLPAVLAARPVDAVVIALPLPGYEVLGSVLATCELHGARALIIPDFFRFVPSRPHVEDLDGLPLLDLRHVPLVDPLNRLLKRTVDVLAAAAALLVLSPLLLASALAVRLSSPGPVLFAQERVGLNRRRFRMYKFRTMRAGTGADPDTTWGTAADPRVTPVGRFLRRFALDELPQLVNVLRGDMSLIGPRPERPFFVDRFRDQVPRYMLKHLVRPGLTGWAQVNGWRGDTDIAERIRCDLYYIENWTVGLDLRIAWRTVWLLVTGRNSG